MNNTNAPMQATVAATRAAVNRENATHSTGPKSSDGKRRASLNALRHGLTGQTVVLPGDDLPAYQESCRLFVEAYKPSGLLESQAVQTIADTQWRLNRIRAMENNLFSLAFDEHSAAVDPSDPAIHCALAQAKGLDANSATLTRLSLYEQRLTRTLAQAKAELKQLQQDRKVAGEQAFEAAAKIRNLKKALKRPFEPRQHGFDFSNPQLDVWIRRRELTRQAEEYDFCQEVPDEDAA